MDTKDTIVECAQKCELALCLAQESVDDGCINDAALCAEIAKIWSARAFAAASQLSR